MTRRALLTALLALGGWAAACAQPDGLLQIGDPVHRFLLRQQAAGRLPDAFLTHLPLSAYEARRYLDALDAGRDALGRTDRALLDRFRGRAPGPGAAWLGRRLPFLYRDGRTPLSTEGDGYAFELSPLLYLSYGRAWGEGAGAVWQNTRGVRAAGHVGRHLFFEARIEENQRRAADAPRLDPGTPVLPMVVPRLGHVKYHPAGRVYDYWQAAGVLGLRGRFFEVRLGRDHNRWGEAAGSLQLSNYAPAYDQLQLRTSVWRLQYVNLFAWLSDLSDLGPSFPNQIIPRRYAALHRLQINLPGQVRVALFESVVFAADTAAATRRARFDFSYLNPVIFYRAVEDSRGSPDNVLLGGELAWNPVPGVSVYTQLLLDEFSFGELRSGRGWVHNKWGWIGGAQLADPLLPGLAIRAEYARIRPYTYGHRSSHWAYVHYADGLGHPAGPNAEEIAVVADAQPHPRLQAGLELAYTRRGRNTPEVNFGADPLRPYRDGAPPDVHAVYGNRIGQGVPERRLLVELRAGYELLPELFLEAAFRLTALRDGETGLARHAAPYATLRWGLPFQSARY